MQLRLNGFLLRETAGPLDALTDGAKDAGQLFEWVDRRLVPLDPRVASPDAGGGGVVIALLERPASPPPWQRFIQEALGLPQFGGGSTSAGAVVFCCVADDATSRLRWLAWCFGSGYRSLRRAATDPRFGLLAALNTAALSSGDAPTLRNLQYRVTAPYFQQAGHRASREIPVDGFRVDLDSDLVSAAGAHTADATFGDVLGGRSLHFKGDIDDLEHLVDLSRQGLARFRSADYRRRFKWIDNMTPVSDNATVDDLRHKLVDAILQPVIPNSIDVLIPDDLVATDDSRAVEFIAYPRERRSSEGRKTLTIEMVQQLLTRLEEFSPGSSLDAELRFFDAADELLGTTSVLECLTAEMRLGDETFVVYDGDFYRVDRSFVDRIDAAVLRIPVSSPSLPCYDGGTEPAYIDKIRSERAADFAVLDRAVLRVEGESPVEACDIISRSGALVHLKRKGKSSVFSHLCSQAAASCSLVRSSPDAQDQLVELVRNSGAPPDLASDIEGSLEGIRGGRGVEVVFGLLGKWGTRTLQHLPLLSKIALAHAVRRTDQMGFHSTALLVDRC